MSVLLKSLFRLFLLAWLLWSTTPAWSQLSGQNIAEFQFGKIPSDTTVFASFYDRLQLDYDIKAFRVGMTLEQYWSPFSNRNYISPNQVRLQYKTSRWDVRIGNFYETLGRGTLMRTYQVPGAILEGISDRSRTFFHRDFVGAYAKYQADSFSIKIMAGQPLNNVFPPTESFDTRRPDSVAAIGADYQIKKHKIEYNTMYLTNKSENKWYSMLNLGGNILPQLSYYWEFTMDHSGGILGSDDEYALYFNFNIALERLNITTEFKDYNNIIIGEAVNEPPAVIKQHVYRLLNRSTHVPIPVNESGWQVEAFYLLKDGSALTFNHAYTFNDLGIDFTFTEFFLEYARLFRDKYDLKVFADYANDDIKGEKRRISTGFDLDILMKKRRSFNVEYEFQTFERFDGRATNILLSLAYNIGSKFTYSLLTEYSTDNTFINEGADYKVWLGGNMKYNPDFRNTFLLFAGTRRGGPACTAGVCFEILDFEGVELRYTRRF